MAHRFYVSNAILLSGNCVELDEEESHHLLKVMRLHPGDSVRIFGSGAEFTGIITETGKKTAVVQLAAQLEAVPPPAIPLWFAFPWIKGGRTETIVLKLTEMGAAHLIIYNAHRDAANGAGQKMNRLQRVAIGACKQCERSDVPAIETVDGIAEAVRAAGLSAEESFLLHERSSGSLLSAALRARLCGKDASPPAGLLFVSGPEGGFAQHEIEACAGLTTSVSLGPRILRAETAPLVAAAVALALAGEV